eukprot:SAG31_NODE_3_length_45830_cov_42.279701_13_plen_98_part_00
MTKYGVPACGLCTSTHRLDSACLAAGRRHAAPGLRRQPPSFLLFPQTSLLVFPRGTLTSLGSPSASEIGAPSGIPAQEQSEGEATAIERERESEVDE